MYIYQLIRFARVCSHVEDFNARNKCFTAKLLKQGYQYHKLRKDFSKFYRRHHELVSKFKVRLKSLLHQGPSEPELVLNPITVDNFAALFYCTPVDRALDAMITPT